MRFLSIRQFPRRDIPLGLSGLLDLSVLVSPVVLLAQWVQFRLAVLVVLCLQLGRLGPEVRWGQLRLAVLVVLLGQ